MEMFVEIKVTKLSRQPPKDTGFFHVLWRQHFHVLHSRCFSQTPGCQFSSTLWVTRFTQKLRGPLPPSSQADNLVACELHPDICARILLCYISHPMTPRAQEKCPDLVNSRAISRRRLWVQTEFANSDGSVREPMLLLERSPQAHVGGQWWQER